MSLPRALLLTFVLRDQRAFPSASSAEGKAAGDIARNSVRVGQGRA